MRVYGVYRVHSVIGSIGFIEFIGFVGSIGFIGRVVFLVFIGFRINSFRLVPLGLYPWVEILLKDPRGLYDGHINVPAVTIQGLGFRV